MSKSNDCPIAIAGIKASIIIVLFIIVLVYLALVLALAYERKITKKKRNGKRNCQII